MALTLCMSEVLRSNGTTLTTPSRGRWAMSASAASPPLLAYGVLNPFSCAYCPPLWSAMARDRLNRTKFSPWEQRQTLINATNVKFELFNYYSRKNELWFVKGLNYVRYYWGYLMWCKAWNNSAIEPLLMDPTRALRHRPRLLALK